MMIAVLEKLKNGESVQFPFEMLVFDDGKFAFLMKGTIARKFQSSKYRIVSIFPKEDV